MTGTRYARQKPRMHGKNGGKSRAARSNLGPRAHTSQEEEVKSHAIRVRQKSEKSAMRTSSIEGAPDQQYPEWVAR